MAATLAAAQGVVLSEAQATLTVDGSAPVSQTLTLPHRWDRDFPARNGRVRYLLSLPRLAGTQPVALYFPRVGNQVEMRVNGHALVRRGELGNPRSDATKSPLWVPVPAIFLSNDGPSELEVVVTVQGSRWGGLAPVLWGSEADTYPAYRRHYVQRHYLALAIVFSLLCVGTIAAALWWLQRDELFGWFALAAAFGVLRFLDVLGMPPWLPWPLWGGVMAAVLQVHIICMFRFFLAMLNLRHRHLQWAVLALMLVQSAMALTAFVMGWPGVWTFTLFSISPMAFVIAYLLARRAWRQRQWDARVLLLAVLVSAVVTVRDLVIVRIQGEGPGMIFWSPLMTLVLVALAAWMIISRYASQVAAHRQLLVSLDDKVNQREAELRASHAQLQAQQAAQATLLERQRITRDIHDGVGAQLVGLLNLIRDPGTSRQTLAVHANAALDELRMAVDSMQPTHRDLTTVLATLRYRLQPRLQAAGIALRWDIGDLPDPDGLSSASRSQVQKIVLEALTNVMRHAAATEVSIQAWLESGPVPCYVVKIVDNGQGFDAARREGRQGNGLTNMHVRAEAMRGQLLVQSPPGGGVTLELRFPPEAGSPAPRADTF